ncbi:MAG: beta-lactamase family protein [Alphaproteobacteria bacterium]|nr:beta-lactamase family protein [Alphaproteobacteria bacterium]MBU2379155.1 beta-lactamase family protein [Alphaproteobacteria bacterium]
MSRLLAVTAAALGLCAAPAVAQTPPGPEIDAAVARLMSQTGSRNLALAVIDGGQVAYVKAYGDRNQAGDPLTTDTVMYGASLTKAVFAYSVMQRVDEGVIDLDRPLAETLPDLPTMYDEGLADRYSDWRGLAEDARWRTITPRMALTHSTGFANFGWLEPDQKIRIHFDPGTRYAYSGDGLILLQFLLEQGLDRDVGRDVQDGVFTPLGMTNTSLMWRPDFAANLADGWEADGAVEPHDERSQVRAAGSMDTTIHDIALFAAALMRGDGISRASRAEMLRPQLPITTPQQFPTLLPELPPGARRADLQAGLGVVTFTGPQGPGFFKGGHNDSTGNTLVCVERELRCLVVLSNDVRSEPGFADLVRVVLGETGVPYDWEYGTP